MVVLVGADGGGCQSSPLPLSWMIWNNRGDFRFIIDGVITLPIALYGFLIFPDVPATTNVFYLSDEVCLGGFPHVGRHLITHRSACYP